MEPVTTTFAETAGKAAAETAKGALETGTAKDLLETAAEAREAIIGEEGLIQQIDSIRSESIEAVAARNEAKPNELSQIEANRESGAAREAAVHGELEQEFPAKDGYQIMSECCLRDKEGNKEARIRDAGGNFIKDHGTGELVPFVHGVQTEVVRRT